MKIKIALASATALGLMMGGAAWAQSNDAFITQDGIGNSALITQTGTQNRAGTSGDPVRQEGNSNDILIQQTSPAGAPSGHGRSRASVGEGGNGIDQVGNNNKLSITQTTTTTNWPTSVSEVQQSAISATGTATTNDAQIQQNDPDGRNSRILRVRQTNTGTGVLGTDRNLVSINQTGGWQEVGYLDVGSRRGVYQDGTGNTATITQSGVFGKLGLLDQVGANNNATLLQAGNGNITNVVSQNSSAGGANVASVSLIGDTNGTASFTGFAARSGYDIRYVGPVVQQGSVLQTGSNTLFLDVAGSSNAYGVTQTGTSSALVDVIGSTNQLSIGQDGRNDADLNIEGSSNNLGLSQATGTGATARTTTSVAITGASNNLGISQQQNGNGTTSLTVNITGDFNNNTGSGFSGNAGSIFFNRAPGYIEQLGNANTASLEVEGDRNLFSLRQSSSGNTISGTIEGSNNQAVVAQSGGDTAVFTQIGSLNNLGVRQ